MAINPYQGTEWGGLFGKQQTTLNDVRAKIGQERETAIRTAYRDAIEGGRSANAATLAKVAEQRKQMAMGLAQNLFGSKDGIVQMDPRLTQAAKRDKDRQEMIDLFKTSKMDKPEDFYRMAAEMRNRGYTGEAAKLVAQGHGFREQTQAEDTISISREDVRGKLALGQSRLSFDKLKEEFDQSDAMVGRSIQYKELAWKKEAKKIEAALTSRGLDIRSNRNRDLRVIADRESDIRLHLGDQQAGIAQQNANTNRYRVKVNEAYGLKEQSRKEIGQAAKIRQADASLALQKQLGLRAADAKDRSNALEHDRNQLADYLGRGRLDFDKDVEKYKRMSTDRLYKMALDKMSFSQSLQERGMTVKESLLTHNIMMDGKKFDHTVLTDEAQHDLAKDMFTFKKEMGYKSDSRADRLFALQKKSKEFGMDMQLRTADFTEEKFGIQEARLQKHMAMEKDFKDRQLDEKAQLREINTILTREGYDIDKMKIKEKREQFSEKLAQDKMLGLKGLTLEEQKIQLRKDISQDDKRLREAGLDIQRMEVKDLKTYRLSSLEMKEKELAMSKTLAQIKANALNPTTTKTVGDDEIAEMRSFIGSPQNPSEKDALRKELGVGSYLSDDDIINAASRYQAWKAKNEGRGITEWKASLLGKKAGGRNPDDVSNLLNPPKGN